VHEAEKLSARINMSSGKVRSTIGAD